MARGNKYSVGNSVQLANSTLFTHRYIFLHTDPSRNYTDTNQYSYSVFDSLPPVMKIS